MSPDEAADIIRRMLWENVLEIDERDALESVVHYLVGDNAAPSPPSRDIPKGWRLVPETPTAAMLKVGLEACDWHIDGLQLIVAYEAAISAAPPAPEAKE